MKTVIEMARDSGFLINGVQEFVFAPSSFHFTEELKHFAELVRADERNSWPAEMEAMERQVNILTDALAAEREACAKVCDDLHPGLATKRAAEIIRARGNT